MENGSYGTPSNDTHWERDAERDGVERQLAHYAFMREERDREVRLLFRDVPAQEIAAAFRAAGAALLSINGERAATAHEASDKGSVEAGAQRKRKRERDRREPGGEVMLRYFYALRGTVYTVNIAFPTGVAASIAAIYPGALMQERELQTRLRMVFT